MNESATFKPADYKVCHLTSVHPQRDGRIFYKECASLAAAGYKVSLLVLGGTDETLLGVDIKGVGFKHESRLKRGLKGSDMMLEAAVAERADIYHLHDPELLIMASRLKKRTGAKVIFDSHEYVPDQIKDKTWIPSSLRGLVSSGYRAVQDRILGKLDGLVIVTPEHTDFFRKLPIPVAIICNYPIITETDFTYQLTEGKMKFVYIGGLFPTRGIRELVEAMEYVDGELHLAGAFHPAKFEHELRQLPGWEKVNYHGLLSREAVHTLLHESQVGLVTLHPTPSYLKALPVKMFEYMEVGIPFIASDFTGFRDITGDVKCCQFADPKNAAEIARAMQFFVNNKGALPEMGKAGFDLVRERYSWEHEGAKLVDFYQQLLTKA